jgi:type IX secretion system PorP/SprF family membrane protein
MREIKKSLLVLLFVFSFYISDGQQTPLNPVSYWVFVPYIYNPAIVGSKDFISVDVNAAFLGKSRAQIISGNSRFSKTSSGYFSSPDLFEFRNAGVGGSVFHDENGLSRNFGATAAGSYQIPLNTRKVSFFSIGASVKGVFNTLDSSALESGSLSKKTFYTNLDFGIYYYGANFFTGLSAVNLLGNPGQRDSLGVFEIPAARQYFFTAGYKIILSRSLDVVLEPSVLINAHDTTFNKLFRNIDPILKLYIGNFCVGTYFFSSSKIPFFAQFRYPKFYMGAYFEVPRKTPFFKSSPTVQFTIGLNIQLNKSTLSKKSHW